MYYRVISQPLSGTADASVDLPGDLLSVTVIPNTTTLEVSVQPGPQSDFLPLTAGSSISFELPGQLLRMPTLKLRCSSAVTVSVLVAYP